MLTVTHLVFAALGFAGGIYALPILTAPPAPTVAEVTTAAVTAQFTGEFRRDLKDSDFLHWGEGKVSVSPANISPMGKLSPGPDYKLYLSPEFVETETDFKRLKSQMTRIGDIKTFENFIIDISQGTDVGKFNTVVVWCESFGQFITAAKYR
jgi:hypothetical protein